MAYGKTSESKEPSGVNCPPMSFNDKTIPASSDGTTTMSFSKKSALGGESRPPAYTPENNFSKNK
jgi:hypothetical protein